MTDDLVLVADVDREPVRWLWPDRIPLGKVTVLDGDPGTGKSTLTLTIAAKVTTASPFPDGIRPERADVILLSAEDDIGDTIRPRLEAAGADLARCWVLPDVQPEPDRPPRPPELPADLDAIEGMVKDKQADLVIIDPIAAFLSGTVDMHRDQDVRRRRTRRAASMPPWPPSWRSIALPNSPVRLVPTSTSETAGMHTLHAYILPHCTYTGRKAAMRMTIYMPDDLAAMVKEHSDLNVSAVCQMALRRELARREEFAKLDKGMKRIVVYDDAHGADVAFIGKELYWSGRIPEETAYLTQRHRLAIYSHASQTLYQFDSFDDLAADEGWRDSSPELVAGVAKALGEDHVIELDI